MNAVFANIERPTHIYRVELPGLYISKSLITKVEMIHPGRPDFAGVRPTMEEFDIFSRWAADYEPATDNLIFRWRRFERGEIIGGERLETILKAKAVSFHEDELYPVLSEYRSLYAFSERTTPCDRCGTQIPVVSAAKITVFNEAAPHGRDAFFCSNQCKGI
jgi:hypothetical protein